ncbi:transcriptional regulator Kaiso-like [Venturia canescens]|uniref:transcriptional regulator Kaiso-like n=1 Tax=Venturia canescens TaxID=32260 RepID=UPI001C9CC48F|nr:transcriptional regulator Kaiso-like [Venturia canescens]XP_043269450.1 transcriptional regulator Kaiso-like [Venturia canescens]
MSFAPDQLFCLRWNNHQANIVEVFDKLLENETFTDVTLAVDNGVFVKCHKMVLAACSTYFQSLFTELPCTHPIVVLKDIKYAEIKEILEYMYTGEVKVAKEHLTQFVRIANILQVKGLMADSTSLTISELVTRNDEVISASTLNNAAQIFEGNAPNAPQSSPPHSTSSPYYGYNGSPTRRNQRSNLPLPMWPLVPPGHNSSLDLAAAFQSSLPMRHSLFSSDYENTREATPSSSRRTKSSGGSNGGPPRNHDTPILRTVLGQGHVDSSISHSNSDPHEYRSHSNDSANNDNDARRTSADAPNRPPSHSPYTTDASIMEDPDRQTSPPSRSDDGRNGIANYVATAQRPEWKRYKQYTRADISNAIEAVRHGMSALQAARKFGVPSRTLYDKVKKLGITTSRPFRRSSNSSGACFPYGLGGNVNGSIYGTVSESENDNSNVLMDNPAALLETAFAESREESSRDRESMMEVSRASPSPPRPPPLYAHRPMSTEDISHQETSDEVEPQVEDLSINRRSDVRVIMSPKVTVKEEN